MASDAHLIIVDPRPGTAEWAELRLRLLEQRWSRFVHDSDICRINRSAGSWVQVTPDTITLIESMRCASRATAGLYDPTMLSEIVDAGYTNSVDDRARISVVIDMPSIGCSVDDVEVDRELTSVRVPGGVGLDPGGIGKGLAGDIVVTELLASGASGALVCVGGDIAVAGSPPPSGWQVGVEDPYEHGSELLRVELNAGGIATSSTQSRRWRRGAREHHHILDPASRACSTTDLAAVTVVGSAGWQAEAFATAAILQGAGNVIGYLEARGLAGVAVTKDREVLMTAELETSAFGSTDHLLPVQA